MEKNLYAILCDFTIEEIAFIIHLYDELGLLNEELLAELIETEERIPKSALGHFKDMLEIGYKAGVGGKKNNAEKIAQKLKNKYIDAKDFFILTKALYSQEQFVLIHLSRQIIGGINND